jgi:hypothetical protein
MTGSSSSGVMLWNVLSRRMPALLMTMSTVPNASTAVCDDRLAALGGGDRVVLATASPPSAVDLVDHLLGRALVATLAVDGAAEVVDDDPGAAAQASSSAWDRPRPPPAPVMIATLPSNAPRTSTPVGLWRWPVPAPTSSVAPLTSATAANPANAGRGWGRAHPPGDVARRTPKGVVAGAGLGCEPLDQRTGRTHQGESAEQCHLGGELGALGRHQNGCGQGDRHPVDRPAHPTFGSGGWVGDHEEQEDQQFGRGDHHPPPGPAGHRADVPTGGHRVAGERHHRRRGPVGDEKRPHDAVQPQAPRHRQPADHDHGVGERQAGRPGAPPQVLGVGQAGPEDQKRHDQRSVGRVE